MAQDVIDLADRLGISRFAVTGNDWGARVVAYTLAALFPEPVQAIAALALAYQPRGEFLGSFLQFNQNSFGISSFSAQMQDPKRFAVIRLDLPAFNGIHGVQKDGLRRKTSMQQADTSINRTGRRLP